MRGLKKIISEGTVNLGVQIQMYHFHDFVLIKTSLPSFVPIQNIKSTNTIKQYLLNPSNL